MHSLMNVIHHYLNLHNILIVMIVLNMQNIQMSIFLNVVVVSILDNEVINSLNMN